VDHPEDIDPFPIVLPGPRPIRWFHLGLIAGALAIVLVVTFSAYCSGLCEQLGSTLGFFGAFVTVCLVVDRIWFRGSERRRLVIDREGFVNEGRRVPWDSVVSIMWMAGSGGEAPRPEHIRIEVRSTPGFEAPRHRVVDVFHSAFGIAPNRLIYLFETAALPRRLSVLAVEPPS
jgi:hypothetical protein